MRIGDTIVKGEISGDTNFNGPISYYDLNSQLLKMSYFKNGKQEGKSILYDDNGTPRAVTSFSDGLQNGDNLYFDSSGRNYYKDFYYYNIPVGPVIYLDNTGIPKRFFFISLQNETLMDIDYRNWKGVRSIYSSCINFSSIRKDEGQISVFLYLINPPRFSFRYAIVKKKVTEKEDSFTEVKHISSGLPFVQFLLPVLVPGEQYAVSVRVYDSLLSRETIGYKDVDQ
jgi:hypothetical protein